MKKSIDDPKAHRDEDGESDEQHREEEVFSCLGILSTFWRYFPGWKVSINLFVISDDNVESES